jgi:hypothetical protein
MPLIRAIVQNMHLTICHPFVLAYASGDIYGAGVFLLRCEIKNDGLLHRVILASQIGHRFCAATGLNAKPPWAERRDLCGAS